MRVYVPISWEQLLTLHTEGVLPGPLAARGMAADVTPGGGQPDQEQGEYEAQEAAAHRLPAADAGVVLALDVTERSPTADGWSTVSEPVRRRDVVAVFTGDLAWYGVQEIDSLLAGR